MVSVSVPSMSNMTKCMACNLTRKRMEPAGSGATWTGSPKGVFAGRKHHKPRQGVVANTLRLFRNGAVGFIDWLKRVCAPEATNNLQHQKPDNCICGNATGDFCNADRSE